MHAHLPYVRHPEFDAYLEEDWLFEAVAETYIPLINVFDNLINEHIDFRITMTLTPPLISMLTDELLQQRCLRYIEKRLELAEKRLNGQIINPNLIKLQGCTIIISTMQDMCLRKNTRETLLLRLKNSRMPEKWKLLPPVLRIASFLL